jgi:hypothetical protein
MPVIISEMIANVRPDNEPTAVDSTPLQASGADEIAQKLLQQQAIDREREERLSID